MVGMERVYDFHGLVGIANTLNRLSEIKHNESSIQSGRAHNKMKMYVEVTLLICMLFLYSLDAKVYSMMVYVCNVQSNIYAV